MDEEKAKEKIMRAMMNTWIKENPGLQEDICTLTVAIISFNSKWGTKIKPTDILPTPTL